MVEPWRPLIRWHGGKWLQALGIIEQFPKHRIYVEPYGGGGSVLMRKPRAYAEVWNDLDSMIFNLFKVLRSPRAAELVTLLRLTPFAREEFELTSEPASDDPVENARRLLVRGFMGFGTNAHGRSTGFRSKSSRSGTTPAHDWANYPDSLVAIIERIAGVVVENRHAHLVMETHDGPDTLHYLDPPYVKDTRSDARPDYNHELDDADHAELLRFIQTLEGHVVLSGYPHEMYDDALRGWFRIEKEARADGAAPRTEVLWINPKCWHAKKRENLPMFAHLDERR